MMSRAGWLKDPWNKVSEIVHELSPGELVRLLKAVWDTLINNPPQVRPARFPIGLGRGRELLSCLAHACPWAWSLVVCGNSWSMPLALPGCRGLRQQRG